MSSSSVFVSHAHHDREFAQAIAAALRDRGVGTPFLDIEALKPGESWQEAIAGGIEKADVIIALISADASQSKSVSAEWQSIAKLSWERGELRVLPVLLDDAQVPPFLMRWQALPIDPDEPDAAARVAEMVDQVTGPQEVPHLREKYEARLESIDETVQLLDRGGREAGRVGMMAPDSPTAVPTNRNTSVYINCPFDPDYRPIFDAMVFAIVCSGYTPRSALETHTASEPRMMRIAAAMHDSKYSIHDLCRCKGAGDENLARFNMPFELGISVAMRFSESEPKEAHDWLVLVPEGEAYRQFISDLAGYDLARYPEAASKAREQVMAAIVSWLITRDDATGANVAPKDVIDVLPEFEAARVVLDKQFCNTTPWPFLVQAAEGVARKRLASKIR